LRGVKSGKTGWGKFVMGVTFGKTVGVVSKGGRVKLGTKVWGSRDGLGGQNSGKRGWEKFGKSLEET